MLALGGRRWWKLGGDDDGMGLYILIIYPDNILGAWRKRNAEEDRGLGKVQSAKEVQGVLYLEYGCYSYKNRVQDLGLAIHLPIHVKTSPEAC